MDDAFSVCLKEEEEKEKKGQVQETAKNEYVELSSNLHFSVV